MPYRFNPFTGEPDIVVDTSGLVSQINADTGSATPTNGEINLLGGIGISTDASGMTVNVNLEVPVLQTNGGTGFSTYTDGQLLIGNSNDGGLDKATLTAGTGITITNGNGSITIDADNNGDVVGPVSSTNNDIALFDGSTGKLIKDGGVGLPNADGQLIIGDTGNTPQLATLTGGTGITITNGAGSITVDADNNGDVVGPASSTDDNFALFDGATGKLIKDSGAGFVGFTSFTPTFAPTTGAFSTYTQDVQARYMQIGQLVFINLRINVTSFAVGTGAGNLKISNLPVTSANVSGNADSGHFSFSYQSLDLPASIIDCVPRMRFNSTDIEFTNNFDNAARSFLQVAALSSGTQVWLSGFYFGA